MTKMLTVNKEQATVFRGANRRYFSKDAAYLSWAWDALSKKYQEFCDCDDGDMSVGLAPSACYFHENREKFRLIARRYADRLKKKDLKPFQGGE